MSKSVVAIVLAAGAGNRMGPDTNKIFLPVGGKALLAWSIELFESLAAVDEVVVVAAPHELDQCSGRVLEDIQPRKVRSLIPGGPTRHQSEYHGLKAIEAEVDSGAIEIVLVHDAARPFAPAGLVRELIAGARKNGSAVPAVPAGPHAVLATSDRAVSEQPTDLWIAQTPQAFRARPLLDAHRQAAREGFTGSDTSSVLEHVGREVRVVMGSYDNIKLTTPDDLLRAEQIARHRAAHPSGEPPMLKAVTHSA